MSDITYTLTESQQHIIRLMVNHKLMDIIDEALSHQFLITDEMVNSDDWDNINARKRAGVEYIKSLL